VVYMAVKYFAGPATPVAETVDNETARMIEKLRLSAESHMDEGDYISGCPSCAWEVYDRIESLQRGNSDAAAGKQAIREHVLSRIKFALDQGSSDEARALIEAAEFYFRNYPDTMKELADLRRQAGQ